MGMLDALNHVSGCIYACNGLLYRLMLVARTPERCTLIDVETKATRPAFLSIVLLLVLQAGSLLAVLNRSQLESAKKELHL